MPPFRDSDAPDYFQRLLTLQTLMEKCQPWAQLPQTDERRQVFDRINARRLKLIDRIASDVDG